VFKSPPPEGGEVNSNSGIVIARTKSLRSLRGPFDTVIVAGGDDDGLLRAIEQSRVHLWLGKVEARRIASVCTGAFVLAASGLLNGRRATTHWGACARLSQLFPRIQVEADAIFVRDGRMWSSAGVTAGIDLALALVEADLGGNVAATVARELVLFLRRPGGQSQYSVGLRAQQSSTHALSDLTTWIIEHPRSDLTISALASRVAMSERNFARVFLRETHSTPLASGEDRGVVIRAV
jgi:transcriptional regulator GlxA family with amidase domain